MESLYTALRNIDRADIVSSLEGQAPTVAPASLEEGACRLGDRDSTLLSPSIINGTQQHMFNKLLYEKSLFSSITMKLGPNKQNLWHNNE